MNSHVLDNPAWSALTGRHASLALGDGPVRRYPSDVSPFAAIETPSALPVLAEHMTEGDTVVLWAPHALSLPEGLDLVICFPILQMAAYDFRPTCLEDDALPLGEADVEDMIALTTLTKPGPFVRKTRLMGNYIGIREQGRLAAMAGERLKPDGYTEVSAICVHPDHLGRGHARRLTSIMGRRYVADGKVPFLNVLPDNAPAISLYQSLGFATRRLMHVHLVRKPGGEPQHDPFFSSL